MSLDSLSRYDDAEDEIKDEDHGLILNSNKVKETQSSSSSRVASDVDSGSENKPKSLVSYIGGDYTDDDSEDDKDDDDDDDDVEEEASDVNSISSKLNADPSSFENGSPASSVEHCENPPLTTGSDQQKKDTDVSVKLPPEPEGRCSKMLQEKIIKMFERKNAGMDVNEYVQKKKAFRNPSIYEKLVSYIGIDEHGTNYPKHIYDPAIWGPESFYEELAKTQKEFNDKKEKEKKDANRAKVEFVSGTKKPPGSAQVINATVPEKKSKWDQGPGKR